MKATGKVVFSTMLFALMTIFGFAGEASAESFAQQEIYNQDGIRVSIFGSEENESRTAIKVLIENDREEDIEVTSKNMSVNGYATDSYDINIKIDAGKKNKDYISIDKEDLEFQDVDTIAYVEFYLEISDYDTGDLITNTEPIRIYSEGNENYVQEYDDSGEVLYDSDGIRIISKGIVDGVFGPELALYVENNMDRNITISLGDTSINDFMVGEIFYLELPAGQHALDNITLTNLDEYQIETIEEIETSFEISDADTYETVVESIPVTITFQ